MGSRGVAALAIVGSALSRPAGSETHHLWTKQDKQLNQFSLASKGSLAGTRLLELNVCVWVCLYIREFLLVIKVISPHPVNGVTPL